MRRLLPQPTDDVDDAALAEHYAYPPGGSLRANMVGTVDGAASLDGASAGLSGTADRRLFRLLRALADVIVVGAGTVRTEDYRPPPAHAELAWLRAGRPAAPELVVVSGRANLDPAARLFADPAQRTLVVTCGAAPTEQVEALRAVSEVHVVGKDHVDLPLVVAMLHERGHRRLLTEGGPALLGSLTAADLLDEIALTVSPLVVGGGAPRIVVGDDGPTRRFRLRGLLVDDDVVFTHYVRTRP